MTRAAAKNHAWVTIVTSPDQYGAAARRAARQRRRGRRRDPPRARAARRSRAPRPTTPRSCSGSSETMRFPRTSCSRSTAPTRRCATARTRTSRRRATARQRHDELVGRRDPARRPRALVPQLLRRRRGVAARARPRRPAPACAIIKHANPCGVARRPTTSPTPTSARSSATSAPRSAASSRSTDRRRGDGRAHGRRPAGRRRDRARLRARRRSRRSQKRRKNTRILEAPRAERRVARRAPDLGRVPRAGAASLRGDARRLAGRHQGRADAPSSGATSSSRGASAGT